NSRVGLITIGAHHLAPVPGPQRPPGRVADRVLDELHGAVTEEHIDPAGMGAAGTIGEAIVRELTGHPAITATADRVLAVVRDLDGVEHRPAGGAHAPAKSPVVLNCGV